MVWQGKNLTYDCKGKKDIDRTKPSMPRLFLVKFQTMLDLTRYNPFISNMHVYILYKQVLVTRSVNFGKSLCRVAQIAYCQLVEKGTRNKKRRVLTICVWFPDAPEKSKI